MADRALLIGINQYPAQPLRGCVNDVLDVARFLLERCSFAPGAIELIVDSRANKANITSRIRDFVGALRSGDRAVFHFSGHGAEVPSATATGELDGLDEAVCPVDFTWDDTRSAIRDREFRRLFANVPEGVSFVWISDSCHSGDLAREILDTSRGEFLPRYLTPPADIAWDIERLRAEPPRSSSRGFCAVARELRIAIVTGCEAGQTSADAVFERKPNGALTYHLLRELGADGGLDRDLKDVVACTADALRRGRFSQRPQLGGSHICADRSFLGLLPDGGPAPSQRWYQLFAELDRRLAADQDFAKRVTEANAGAGRELARALQIDLAPASVPPDAPASPGGAVVRAFWWGFHIQIAHEELRRFLPLANPIDAIAAALGPVTGPAAPFIGMAAGFVAGSLALLKRIDRGRGVYVSMSWFAPGVFVPTFV